MISREVTSLEISQKRREEEASMKKEMKKEK
jgi:hypothetical protein